MNRRLRRRVKTHRKKKHIRKTRKRSPPKPSPPKLLNNYSPISSPGSTNSFELSPSPIKTPKTPMTKRAEELASMYPDTRSMIQRSQSFNNAASMSTENFYREFESLFPHGNNYYDRFVR